MYHKSKNSVLYGSIGELFVEVILNYFKNGKRLDLWLTSPREKMRKYEKLIPYDGQITFGFPESEKGWLSEEETWEREEQERFDDSLKMEIIKNDMKILKQYESCQLLIKNVKKIALKDRYNSLIILDNKKGIHKLKYPDFRIDLDFNSPWVEVKSIYPQYLERIINKEYYKEEELLEVNQEGIIYETEELPIWRTLVKKTIEKYIPHQSYYHILEDRIREKNLTSNTFFEYTSKWFQGNSPCSLDGSYIEGFVFLHIQGAESSLCYSEISEKRTAFTRVIGTEEFMTLLNLFDLEKNTDLSKLYRLFLQNPSEFLKNDYTTCLEKLKSTYQLKLFE